LPVDKAEKELVVAREKPGGIDQIGAVDRIQDVLEGHAGAKHLRGIGRYLKFGNLAALNEHARDTVEAVQARLEIIGGNLPQLGLRDCFRCEAISQDREAGEIEAMGFDSRSRGQSALNP